MWDLRKLFRRQGSPRVEVAAHPLCESFESRVRSAGVEFDALTPDIAMGVMLDWYVAERVPGCDIAENGDMLLYQWGESAEGAYIDITRQLMTGDGEDEDIFQLGLTLTFDVRGDTFGSESGNRWCEAPDEVEEFRAFIEASEAFKTLRNRQPVRVQLDYGSV